MPIPEWRRGIYDYYKLTFAADGCPMKKTPVGDVFHPILAAYLCVDYMTWFKKTKERKYIDLAEKVALLALAHAERRGDALVFLYRPEHGLSYVPGEFYSALTQAWYLKALCNLRPYSRKRSKRTWNEELASFFNSLLIGIEERGVLIKKDIGWIVEEYPHEIPLYTLNGWLTALRIVRSCDRELQDAGVHVSAFMREGLRAVEALLPLYDAGFCCNSRYQLSGFTRVKLVFDRPVAHQLRQFEIEIPGEGIFEGKLQAQNNRWGNYVERTEARLLQFNVIQSLISHPRPNRFRCTLTVDKDCTAQLHVADGDYRPDTTAMPTQRWRKLAKIEIPGAGPVTVARDLSWDDRNLFAYPTNFKKKIGGLHYNAYHFVHIIDLAELYAYSLRPRLKEYALRWLEYTERWEGLPFLQNSGFSTLPHAYGADFPAIVQRALASRSGWAEHSGTVEPI